MLTAAVQQDGGNIAAGNHSPDVQADEQETVTPRNIQRKSK